ncbi:uncharacterized protein LOC129587856 [Paramacrobiotus metropolitanus]|uniref:uncharacterized protein LOC129587856 n=1 Tax=Paramacrobiotus metropolitanus TaxID=2943436 RepID=UPI0024464667|nr:uncharacterized protein LOC129587856 [Paramacrobiotus metropolitanus]
MQQQSYSVVWCVIMCLVENSFCALAEGSPPQFAVKKPEFSVCAPDFSGRVGATDADGDKIFYSLVSSSPSALDYVVDAGTGTIKSFRPFNANEKSVFSVQATDATGLSSIITVTVIYQECGSRLVEPDQPSSAGSARFLEPFAPRNASIGGIVNISRIIEREP